MSKKIIIKINNEAETTFPHRIVGGLKDYVFLFNKQVNAYCYAPQDLIEQDDIFNLVSTPNFPWRFSPVLVDSDEPEKPGAPLPKFSIPPYITADRYADHTLDELLALAADVGLRVQGAHAPDLVRLQLDAYMVGRAVAEKALSELPKAPAGGLVPFLAPEPPAEPAPQPPAADPAPVTESTIEV